MKRIKAQQNYELVARILADLALHRDRNEALANCIDCFKANKDRMRCDPNQKRGFPIRSSVSEKPTSKSSGPDSNGRSIAGRKQEPTLFPLSNTALQTIAGPTSSIGGLVVSQPLD